MNKNTKRLRRSLRTAAKAGESELAVTVPASGYHNNDKGAWQTRRIPTARLNGEGVNSSSVERNTQQRVLRNTGGGSLTVHEARVSSLPVRHKQHAYLIKNENGENSYRQPKSVAAS